jgi:myo-inositol catabolism protein IolC
LELDQVLYKYFGELMNHSEFFFLPFDHRGSFEKDFFGIIGRNPTKSEAIEISCYKKIIYEGFKQAILDGVPKEKAGILVDEEFGFEILVDAKKNGFITACSVEKSGQKEFDFEYGADFKNHILSINPDFVKVLVRYNPEGDAEVNYQQTTRLKNLSDFCIENRLKFMFELLVPATTSQLANVNDDVERYDHELRPNLMVEAIKEIQKQGIEPSIWKVEGSKSETDYKKIVLQAKSNSRDHVGLIVLGRGENSETIKKWLSTAAITAGFIGFAIGRTVWEETLMKFKDTKISSNEAIMEIAKNFKMFCDLWIHSKNK